MDSAVAARAWAAKPAALLSPSIPPWPWRQPGSVVSAGETEGVAADSLLQQSISVVHTRLAAETYVRQERAGQVRGEGGS